MVSGATGTQIAAALPIEAATGVPARKIAEAVAAYLIDCDDFEAWLTDDSTRVCRGAAGSGRAGRAAPGACAGVGRVPPGGMCFVHRMIADAKAVLRGPKAEATSFQREDAHDQLETLRAAAGGVGLGVSRGEDDGHPTDHPAQTREGVRRRIGGARYSLPDPLSVLQRGERSWPH